MLVAASNAWDALIAVAQLVGIAITAALAFRNGRRLRTPSGDPIGHVAERTHDLAAINATQVARLNGGGKDDKRAAP